MTLLNSFANVLNITKTNESLTKKEKIFQLFNGLDAGLVQHPVSPPKMSQLPACLLQKTWPCFPVFQCSELRVLKRVVLWYCGAAYLSLSGSGKRLLEAVA